MWVEDDACASNQAGDCGFPFSDLYCDEATTQQCIPYLAIGDVCLNVGLCDFKRYNSCDSGGTGRCVGPTTRTLGQSCQMFGGQKCAVGLLCSNPFDGGTCVTPPDVGDPCDTPADCGDFLLECVNDQCQYGEHSGMCPAS